MLAHHRRLAGASTCGRQRSRWSRRTSTLLGDLLQLNPAEQALLLYGTLARYQRDLRGLLVEFKVASAQEAYAALAEVAGVDQRDVAEALRAGSRLERIGMLENLLSEHNITDLADLMKVSDQLPPVLMREYRDPHDLMAVFTRPHRASASWRRPTSTSSPTSAAVLSALLRAAVARREVGVNLLLYGPPGTGKTELARVVAQAAGLELTRWSTPTATATRCRAATATARCRSAQVFLQGQPGGGAAVRRGRGRVPAARSDAAQLIARLERAAATARPGSVNGKAWVNQILESNPVPVLGSPTASSRSTRRSGAASSTTSSSTAPPPGAREALVRRALGPAEVSAELIERLTERSGADAGADPHRGALRPGGRRDATRASRRRGRWERADRAPARARPTWRWANTEDRPRPRARR